MSMPYPAQVTHPSHRPANARPKRYVCIPHTLARAAQSRPRAIGIYALIARQFLITGEAMPVSPTDLTRFDPTLSRGSALRALNWLLDQGYLSATHSGCGQKRHLSPTWGRIRGELRNWDRTDSRLGRPPHIHVSTLDVRLLDVLIGRFHPSHEHRAARVGRYLSKPLLTLADVGTYALALTGVPIADAPALVAAGLLMCDGQQGYARPLPDDMTMLASLSQPTPARPELTLTEHGYAALGVPSQATTTGQPLFFVDRNRSTQVIANLITDLITDDAATDSRHTAAGGSASGETCTRQDIPREKKEKQRKTTSSERRSRDATFTLPETESARRLEAYHVIPAYVARFGALPLTVIEHVIRCADHTAHVRSKPGYVVWALGEYIAHNYLPTMPSIPETTDWTALAQQYATDAATVMDAPPDAPGWPVGPSSEQATTPAGGEADSCTTEGRPTARRSEQPDMQRDAETPDEPVAVSLPQANDLMRQQTIAPMPSVQVEQVGTGWDGDCFLQKSTNGNDAPARWQDMLAAYVPRTIVPVLQRLDYQVTAQGAYLHARDQTDQAAALVHLPAIQACCVAAGLPRPTRCTLAVAPVVEPPPTTLPTPPAWIDDTRWAALSPLLRQALIGSTLADGQVVPARPGAARVLAHAAADVAELVAAYRLEESVYI